MQFNASIKNVGPVVESNNNKISFYVLFESGHLAKIEYDNNLRQYVGITPAGFVSNDYECDICGKNCFCINEYNSAIINALCEIGAIFIAKSSTPN